MSAMTPGQLQIRRATLDDLPALRTMWGAAGLPAAELEARLTEFHVVSHEGEFAGAIGLQIMRQHARMHSEDYTNFAVADAARELFWERIQKIAANLGIFRLWTQETSPFWTRWGFKPALSDELERLPAEWKGLEGQWLTLELKDEEAINQAMKIQFTNFMDAEKAQTAKVMGQARVLRGIIIVIGFGIFFVCIAVAVFLMMGGVRTPGR